MEDSTSTVVVVGCNKYLIPNSELQEFNELVRMIKNCEEDSLLGLLAEFDRLYDNYLI